MADDIVTRLREINVRYVLKDELFLADALSEAADEIERLRKTIQMMSIDYRCQIAGLKMRCKCGANNG